ncbi:MAG: FecR domain-containing protein [Turneriella sp.]
MKFSRNDAIFSAAILVGIAGLSALLYRHMNTRSMGKGESIGKVYYKREVAMRKLSDRMVWEDVESGSPLYTHDAVMTGSYSDAELVLNNGLKLKLEANTLVELDLEQEGLTLRLSGGGIKTAGAQNSQTTVTTQNGQSINVTEGSASIRSQGNQVAVEVKEGKVEVTSKEGKKETVSKDEVLAAGKKSRVALQLTAPADETQYLTATDAARVAFACAPAAATKQIEIARSADFTSARRLALTNGNVTAAVQPGDWFVRCNGSEDALSGIRRLRVVQAGNYQILRPEKNEVSFSDKPAVRLEFRAPRSVTSTRVEVFDNAQFSGALYAQTVQRRFVELKLPKAGKYYYRLTPASDAGSVESQLSPFNGSVTLTRSEAAVPLAFVSLSTPSFPLAQVEAGKAFIAYEGSGKLKAEILDTQGQVVQGSETQGGTFIVPTVLTGGKYQIRLTSTSGEKITQRFEVRDKVKVDLLSPENGTTIYLTPGEKTTSLSLSWRANGEVQLYQLVLAEDAAMKSVIKKINVDTTEFRFTGLSPRRYYVRVLALENNIPRSESAIVSVAVEEKLQPVAELFPKPAQTVDITKTAGIPLKWQPVAGANSYEVRMFQKRKGSLVLVDARTTKGTAINVADFKKFKEGDVVWEVRAQQTDKSGRVVQKSEPTRSHMNLSFGPNLPAPEIVPTVDD